MVLERAKRQILESSLNIGAIIYDNTVTGRRLTECFCLETKTGIFRRSANKAGINH
jgi:hypothetical protein